MNKKYTVISEIETPLGYSIEVRQNEDNTFDVGYVEKDDTFKVKHNNLSANEVINALSFYTQSAFHMLKKKMVAREPEVLADYMVEYSEHPWLKTKTEVINWVVDNLYADYTKSKLIEGVDFTINSDLSVNLNLLAENIYIENTYKGVLPIKIKEAHNLISEAPELRSFIGTPEKAKSIIFNDCMITSLEGLSGNFDIVSVENNFISNFRGMAEKLNINRLSLYDNPIKTWDGFTFSSKLSIVYWSKNYDDVQKKLLLETPMNIQGIEVNFPISFNGRCPWLDMSGCHIDMDALKLDAYRIKEEKKNKFNSSM